MTLASEPAIEARFSGRLGGFQLDAAFSAPGRGITALVGPSGSGKTSLLRCIAGLTRLPGRLWVGDQIWQDERRFLPPHRRAVGFVFQEPSLLPHLTVRRNLMFGFDRSRERTRIGLDEVVGLLGVEPLLHRATQQLSGGERQRVAIGRALLSQPDLLLMDEPLSSLDADSKAEILPFLERLPKALSIPILYVSHDLSEVARLADHALVMQAGRILTPDAATGAPLNEAEAREELAGSDNDRISRLAIAALMAGLGPLGKS
jgi:molybdate transport system ATP-binding protein